MSSDPRSPQVADRVDLSLARNLRHDVPAGLVVALVAIPLCLGIALASGAPLLSGVIAGIVGGLVVPLLSRSPLSVSGPAAGLTAIIIGALHSLGSFEVFTLAVVLAGAMQVVLGLVRAGAIAYFFPSAVIEGMLAAIGLILILKQFTYAVGVDIGQFGSQAFESGGENSFSGFFRALEGVEWGALLVSLLTLAILLTWERVAALRRQTWLQGPLVAVIAAVALNAAFGAWLPALALGVKDLVKLPLLNSPVDFIGMLRFPDWHALGNASVWITAATMAVVASLESLLSIEAADKLDPFRRRTPLDGELVAQGVANGVSGLIGGLPVTAVIVRSSTNIAAGGRTRTAAFVHGLFLLVAVLFLTSTLNRIPLAALATILMLVGYKLAKPSLFLRMWRDGLDRFLPFVVTVAAILLTDLLIGVAVGLLVGVFFVLKANFHAAVTVRKAGGAFRVVFNREVSFVNKATLSHILERLPDGARVVIDTTRVHHIDHDILEILADFAESAPLRGIVAEECGGDRIPSLRSATPCHRGRRNAGDDVPPAAEPDPSA